MKKEYVSLIPAREGENGPIQWTMIHGGNWGQGQDYPDIDLEKGGDYQIIFTIFDTNNLGIKFDTDVADSTSNPKALDAVWIAQGSGAQKKAGPYPEQIDFARIQKNGTQLVIGDKNSEDEVFTYQLNFTGPQNLGTITPIDPEIRNGGGTGGRWDAVEALALLLGGVVFALVGLLWFNHFRIARRLGSPAKAERSAM